MKRTATDHVVSIGLSTAIVSVAEERPRVLVVHRAGEVVDALPFGPFDPLHHRTLESGLRSWVGEQTSLDLGYAEQLYTFGDRGRHLQKAGEGPRVVSVGYLALTRGDPRTPIRNGAIGTASSHGKIGAMPNRASSKKSSRQSSKPSPNPLAKAKAAKPAAIARACALVWTVCAGTKKKSSNATNFSMKPDWWRKPSATAA